MQVLVPDAPEESLEDYYRHYDELHGSLTQPFEGLSELLDELRRLGIRLGIVTGKAEKSLRISLGYIGLEGAFDALEAGCPNGPCKPDGIRRILQRWSIDPSDALYVGDALNDIQSAREVGIPIASVSWAEPGIHEKLRAAKPDFLFSTVNEFREWILHAVTANG